MKWRKMETAPKDGTAVLVYRNTWCRPRVGKYTHGTWWTDGQPCSIYVELHWWQPLPALPKTTENKL